MKPIIFTCHANMPIAPEAIASQILDLEKWSEFHGYGPLPGIKSAEFEIRTPAVEGTRIKVTNRDGSSHVEEITHWQPDKKLELRFTDFTPPLSKIANYFVERWELKADGAVTEVKRSMELYPKAIWSRPLLWAISCLLKGAIAKHLRQLSG